MKQLTTSKKKLLILLSLSTALCLGAAAMLSVRVYDIVEYFGSEPAAGQPPTEGTTEDEDAKFNPPPPGDATPNDSSKKPGGNREIPITPTQTGELPVTTAETAGILRRTTVELPASALEWTQEGKHPAVGDHIRISIPGVREYIMEVASFRIEENTMVVDGPLTEGSGECIMFALRERINVKLVDRTNSRVFNLYFNKQENSYTVEEMDPSLRPTESM